MNTDKVICPTCGTGYSKRKGFFPVSYGELYKGLGYIPYCRSCIDKIYSQYLAQCKDSKMAVRQTCRKLDLYWNENIFDSVVKKSSVRSLMTQYIVRINSVSCAGKSYDDTLLDEGILWSFDATQVAAEPQDIEPEEADEANTADDPDIPKEVIAFWGAGYSKEMYEQLEQRRKYYSSKFPDAFSDAGGNDIGSDVLMRQLCNLEVSISKDAAAGRSIDKSVNSLNTLIGSLNLKPAQKKSDELDASIANTPLGVWLFRYENKRPLPEIDKSLQDVNRIKKYVFTWLGHICKMCGVKNGYTRMYEEEINRLRVEKPEYEDEDDESVLMDAYSGSQDGDESWIDMNLSWKALLYGAPFIVPILINSQKIIYIFS